MARRITRRIGTFTQAGGVQTGKAFDIGPTLGPVTFQFVGTFSGLDCDIEGTMFPGGAVDAPPNGDGSTIAAEWDKIKTGLDGTEPHVLYAEFSSLRIDIDAISSGTVHVDITYTEP